MKKYKAEANWRVSIEIVECDKETESSVWIKGRRNNKRSSYENYFDTFDEAREFCLYSAVKKVVSAQRALEEANIMLDIVKGMKEP